MAFKPTPIPSRPTTGQSQPTPPPTAKYGAFYSGTGAPSGVLGGAGDYYIDTQTIKFYGPKTNSGWGPAITISQGASGPIGPKGDKGDKGDIGLSIIGPKGDKGDKGDRGLTGTIGTILNLPNDYDSFTLTRAGGNITSVQYLKGGSIIATATLTWITTTTPNRIATVSDGVKTVSISYNESGQIIGGTIS